MIISSNTNEIANALNKNQVVCFKTDTIWGLSANPTNKEAVKNLYTFKQRNVDKPFIFLIKKDEDLSKIVKSISPTEQKLINAFWPGPLTIIFKAKNNLDILSHYTQKQTIALRMPNDSLCQELLAKINYPLPSTSVNIEGQPFLNSFEEITKTFKDNDFVIYQLENNNTKVSSTIVCCEGEKVNVLREGSITKNQIENCLKN